MKFKKLGPWLAVALLAVSLAGCQLAKEELGPEAAGADRLIGVFITFEPLPADRVAGTVKNVIVDGYEMPEYKFSDLVGVPYLYIRVPATATSEDYWTWQLGPEIFDSHTHYHAKDGGYELTLQGNLFLLEEAIVYPNRVFQTPGGAVYVEGEMGMSITGFGVVSTMTLEGTVSSEEEKFACTVEITAERALTPQRVLFKQMNDRDEVIQVSEVLPAAIPDDLWLEPDCAYVLVAVYSGETGETVERSLLDLAEGYYTYRYAGDNGYLIGKSIKIEPGR